MYAAPPKKRTRIPCSPTSAMVSTSGYVSGSHMIICGFFSMPDMIATVGNSAAFWMPSSV